MLLVRVAAVWRVCTARARSRAHSGRVDCSCYAGLRYGAESRARQLPRERRMESPYTLATYRSQHTRRSGRRLRETRERPWRDPRRPRPACCADRCVVHAECSPQCSPEFSHQSRVYTLLVGICVHIYLQDKSEIFIWQPTRCRKDKEADITRCRPGRVQAASLDLALPLRVGF